MLRAPIFVYNSVTIQDRGISNGMQYAHGGSVNSIIARGGIEVEKEGALLSPLHKSRVFAFDVA